MGFQVKIGYQPGLTTMQVDRTWMAFLKASHEIYFTQGSTISIIADDKCLPATP
jgi:hypothetical protein